VEELRKSKKYVDTSFVITNKLTLFSSAQVDDSEEDPMAEPPDPNQMFTVLISTRSFLKFLNSHVVSTTTIACEISFLVYTYLNYFPPGLCQHHCLILYVYIGDVADAGGVLTFYIPAIIDDEGR
jgi:HUS1 checkpoint protein